MDPRSNGWTLIELLVATLVFSIVATGLAQVLLASGRARRSSGLWMQATELAEQPLESLRAGGSCVAEETIGTFTRRCRAQVSALTEGLQRIDVTVEWDDGGTRQFTLSALLRDGA
jgi:prepilin-type N-terminal cleavage/methylation domain-containing protein